MQTKYNLKRIHFLLLLCTPITSSKNVEMEMCASSTIVHHQFLHNTKFNLENGAFCRYKSNLVKNKNDLSMCHTRNEQR